MWYLFQSNRVKYTLLLFGIKGNNDMSTPITDFVKTFYRQRQKKSKSTLFHFQEQTLYLGKCTIAVIQDKLLLINETVDMPEVNRLRDILLKTCKEFKYTPILIPFKYGEEDMPNNEEIQSRLINRLEYWLGNTQELSNNEIRGQYKTFYEQFMKFLSTTSQEEINADLNALYKHIKNRKYLKQLKLEVARRRNIK